MYIREEIKNQIINAVNAAVNDAIEDGDFSLGENDVPAATLEVPREKAHGDFACTIAMQLPKLAHQAPKKIAESIINHIDVKDIPVESVSIAGPGFINFKLKPNWSGEAVKEVLSMGEDYGKSDIHKGKTYNMEFVSANPTGPMHVGNARGGAIGDVLASIAAWTGYDVTREFYVNDAGNQIKKLEDSLEARYHQILGEDYPLPEDAYQGEDITDRVRDYMENLSQEELKELKEMDVESRKKALSAFTVEKNLKQMQKDLSEYGIDYDVWFSEQSLYDTGQLEEALKVLRENGYVYDKDGAVWFRTTDFGLPKDDVLVRENGIPTYFLGDIAYHMNKFLKRDFDRGVNVWGADHYGHVARLKAALEAAGAGERLEIVLMQLVKLLQGDQVVKMSKRTGQMITLSELVEDIGIDAARFFFNLRSPESHLEFDLDLAIKESNENPVFYVQYAHARIASILRKLEEADISDLKTINTDLLTAPEEIALMQHLSRLPNEIIIAEDTMDPSRITRYALDLASAFHTFYNACRVNVDDIELKKARTALIQATKQVLENVSSILGIEAPERM